MATKFRDTTKFVAPVLLPALVIMDNVGASPLLQDHVSAKTPAVVSTQSAFLKHFISLNPPNL